jgi:hypothetical protein
MANSVIQEITVPTIPFPQTTQVQSYLNRIAYAVGSFFLAFHEAYIEARELRQQAEQRYRYFNFDH